MVELSKQGYAPANVEVVDVLSVVHAVVGCDQSKDDVKPAARQARSGQQTGQNRSPVL